MPAKVERQVPATRAKPFFFHFLGKARPAPQRTCPANADNLHVQQTVNIQTANRQESTINHPFKSRHPKITETATKETGKRKGKKKRKRKSTFQWGSPIHGNLSDRKCIISHFSSVTTIPLVTHQISPKAQTPLFLTQYAQRLTHFCTTWWRLLRTVVRCSRCPPQRSYPQAVAAPPAHQQTTTRDRSQQLDGCGNSPSLVSHTICMITNRIFRIVVCQFPHSALPACLPDALPIRLYVLLC